MKLMETDLFEDRFVEFNTPYARLDVNEIGVLRAIGYFEGTCPEIVRLSVREAIETAESLCRVRGGYRILPWEARFPEPGRLQLGETVLGVEKIVAGQMKRTRRVAVFAVTIGDRLEDAARERLLGDDPIGGFVLDTLASLAADAAAEHLQRRLRDAIAPGGWTNTNRYSPGYCGWPVDEQRKLFDWLPDDAGGIRLSPTALMHPLKSVSGIVGLGPDVVCHPYPCDFCNQRDCIMRRGKK
jgi:hypothetical protein